MALKVEPAQPQTVPSQAFLDTLKDLGASEELIEIATGKRKYRFRLLRRIR